MIPEEVLLKKIYLIRKQKVMFDRDLAELYGVETRHLKRQVRRNIERFPEDFMFSLTSSELESWWCQFGTSDEKESNLLLRHKPYVFTEQGVAQLSCVLKSERAINVNIQIIRLFTKMREMLVTHKDLIIELEAIKKKIGTQDEKIDLIFDYLKQFAEEKAKPRKQIGYKRNSN